MAGFRDSRFGQFADPNFGASLSTPQPSQGVLPAPEASTSASSDQSNNSASSWGMPGLIGGGSGSNPGSVYLAEGGPVPGDTGQDSGDAGPANTDPFSMITSALATGRKQFGLPANFSTGSDTGNSDGPQPQSFAEGGVVQGEEPDDSADDQGDDQQGVIPDQSQDQEQQPQQGQQQQGQQGGGQSSQSAMAYLKGAGAVPPEIANALERQVDPHGQMDPSLRKTLAVTQAGDPNKAFGLMQHYRQKFNALGAFAKAALQGSGGRPPNVHAAADALNKAYAHVPDGTSLQFEPAQGGMRVTSRNVMPGKDEQPQQQPQQGGTQSFEEGGPVEEEPAGDTTGNDPMIPEQQEAGSDTSGVMPQQSGDNIGQPPQETEGSQSAQGAFGALGKFARSTPGKGGILGGKAPHEWLLSIPQLMGWQAKAGQFDHVMDTGVDTSLQEAAQSGMAPGAPGTFAPQSGGQQQPQQQQPQSAGQDAMAQAQPGQYAPSQQPQDMRPAHKPTPQGTPEQVGAQIGEKSKEEGLTIRDALHQLDIAYGNWAGQQKTKALAKAELIKTYAVEQVKGQNSLERAKITGGFGVEKAKVGAEGGVQRAQIGADASVQKGENHEAAATGRTHETNETKGKIAHEREGGVTARFQQGEGGRDARAIIQAKPSLVGDQGKMDAAKKVMSTAPPRQVSTQQQPTQGTGPAPTSVPPPGMKYQQDAAGTKWRLVPAQ